MSWRCPAAISTAELLSLNAGETPALPDAHVATICVADRQGDLDRLMIPEAPLDILAQQIVATCASGSAGVSPALRDNSSAVEMAAGHRHDSDATDGWDEDELFELVRRAYPYRNLSRETYTGILEMLSEGIASSRGRYGAYIHHDRVNKKLRPRRGARLAAITSGGAIPETALYTVVAQPEGTVVGTLDEDFAIESNRDDIVLLGNMSWRIRRVESKSGRVIVEDAHGAAPTVPFWLGEAPARTQELSAQVADLRKEISDRLPNVSPVGVSQNQPVVAQTVSWLKEECGLDDSAAEQAIEYILQGRAVLGTVPTQETIIAERFFDEGGGMQLVIHAPFGGRINKAWGLALRKRFCRGFNFELQAAATDNGLNISLAEQHSFPLADVFHFLSVETVQEILEQAALASPIFGTRWRWDANRALALLRFMGGKKVPPQIQRMRSDDLLAAVFPDVAACQENIEGDIKIPDHPLVKEVMKDVLTEAMDIEGLKELLRKLENGSIRSVAVDTPVPSQFSHEILNANPYAYLDDAPLEERRARAVEMRRILPESVLEEVGKLDPAAIAQVRDEAWPDVRDADELHDVLHTLVVVPADTVSASTQHWQFHFERLAAQGRAIIALNKGRTYWVAAERTQAFSTLFPEAIFTSVFPDSDKQTISPDDSLLISVTGWMAHLGPVTASKLGEMLGIGSSEIDKALLRMEASGAILRGKFTEEGSRAGAPALHEWCERRLLARIHRLTVATLRKQVEPVTAAQFMRWLLCWQHVAPSTQVIGERATLDVVRQLQGFEIPANAWERHVLARRISNYDPAWLDQLCLTGAVGWGRLSPHPATLEDSAAGKRRVIPTSVAPITFFVREEADWMTPHHPAADPAETRGLGEVLARCWIFCGIVELHFSRTSYAVRTC